MSINWWYVEGYVDTVILNFNCGDRKENKEIPLAFFCGLDFGCLAHRLYRCDNRRFWLSSHNCMSSPNPNFSKSRTRTANSDLWSRLAHQLLGRLKSTIPNLCIYQPKKENMRSWGWGLTIHAGWVFWVCGWTSAWRGLIAVIFGILEASATQ